MKGQTTMTERDTHFQGAAKLVVPKILQEIEPYTDGASLYCEECITFLHPALERLIAQFAYDLVQSACIDINNAQVKQGVRLHPNAMLRAIADLDAWPEPPTTVE